MEDMKKKKGVKREQRTDGTREKTYHPSAKETIGCINISADFKVKNILSGVKKITL